MLRQHRSNLLEMIHLIRAAGRVPAQRSTTYEHIRVLEDPADDPVDERVVSHLSSIAVEGGGVGESRKMLKVTPVG